MARCRRHPVYYAIKGFQSSVGLTDEQMAEKLGISARSYHDKVFGFSDFTVPEAITLKNVFGKTLDEIFLI